MQMNMTGISDVTASKRRKITSCAFGTETGGLTMKFFKNGILEDKKIEAALRKAADDYEDGALIEVRDLLLEIINAIDEFADREEI